MTDEPKLQPIPGCTCESHVWWQTEPGDVVATWPPFHRSDCALQPTSLETVSA